jgi:organic radical activating enzyme
LLKNLNLDSCYIYGFSLAGKWLSTEISCKVNGFVDTDQKKKNFEFNGYKVSNPQDLSDKEPINFVVAAMDIHEILPNIKLKFPNANIYCLGEYLKNQKVEKKIDGKEKNFVEYSLKGVESCHKSFLDNDTKFIRSMDVVISERCSLKCVDCSNLMQFYESPQDISYEEILKDFDALLERVNHIYEIRLIGGEPFMNKEIYTIINYFLANEKISKIVVYTNATIPLKADEMKGFNNSKLVFFITDYGSLSKNTEKVKNILDEMSVAYRAVPPENWTDSAKIGKHSRNEIDNQAIFDKCCGKNLYTLMYGKLYRCPFTANAERLKAIPNEKDNSVLVTADSSEISSFLYGQKYTPACDHCNGRSYDAPEIIAAIQTKDVIDTKTVPYKKYIHIRQVAD